MAFSIDVHFENFEYRGMREGQGQNGRWLSLILEDTKTRQVDVSVPSDLQEEVLAMHLSKGDYVSCDAVAYAGAEYSRIRLVRVTEHFDRDGEVL